MGLVLSFKIIHP